MTSLAPMSAASYEAYYPAAVERYAESLMAAHLWPREVCRDESQRAFATGLAQGLDTPDACLFDIKGSATGATVGSLFFKIQGKEALRTAYVNDLFMAPAFRRQGHASRAFAALEHIMRELGLMRIELNVWGYNTAGQAFYASLGYAPFAIAMRKII